MVISIATIARLEEMSLSVKHGKRDDEKRSFLLKIQEIEYPSAASGFPRKLSHRSHRECQRGYFPRNVKAQRARMPKITPSSPSITHQLIADCIQSDITTDFWTCLLATETIEVFEALAQFTDPEQASFLRKHEEARLLWFCHGCNRNKWEDIVSGYVSCSACDKSFHQSCAKNDTSHSWLCNDFVL